LWALASVLPVPSDYPGQVCAGERGLYYRDISVYGAHTALFEFRATEYGPEEWQELQHIQSLEQLIHLEIESLYTFAKILLDRIADTFSYFYSVPLCKKGSPYSQLTTKFESICTDRGSLVEPPDLLALMQDLKIHVTEFRTNKIEHFSAPGVMFGKSQNAQIVQTMLCPSIPFMPSEQTQDVDELLAKIDCFIPAIIQFFEANLKKSILHRTPSPST
jgi:hypothetical protein